MGTWNLAYEAIPQGSASPSEGDDEIRDFKLEFRSRSDQEHVILNTASTGQSVHRPGSAVCYFQDAEPTLRPDGITALGSDDTGRFWVDSNNGNLLTVYDNGSGTWESITVNNIANTGSLSVAGTLTVTGETTCNDHLNLGASADIRISSTSLITTGGELLPDCSNGGMCLNQTTQTQPILTFKSTSVSHPFTSIAELDTYVQFERLVAAQGGTRLDSFISSGTATAFELRAHSVTNNSTTSISARAPIELEAYKTNGGTGTTAFAVDDNLLTVVNAQNGAVAIVKGDGDLYLYGAIGSYDRENDLELSRALQLRMAGLEYNEEYGKRNEELGISQNGMLSTKRTFALLLGAVWQLSKKVEQQDKKISRLKAQKSE